MTGTDIWSLPQKAMQKSFFFAGGGAILISCQSPSPCFSILSSIGKLLLNLSYTQIQITEFDSLQKKKSAHIFVSKKVKRIARQVWLIGLGGKKLMGPVNQPTCPAQPKCFVNVRSIKALAFFQKKAENLSEGIFSHENF